MGTSFGSARQMADLPMLVDMYMDGRLKLDELISRRYNADLPIVATTNYAPGPSTGLKVGNAADLDANGKVRHRPALVDRVGPRVYSRLREMCDFIGVTGEDYR